MLQLTKRVIYEQEILVPPNFNPACGFSNPCEFGDECEEDCAKQNSIIKEAIESGKYILV